MPHPRALNPQQAQRAAELYLDGKSRIQIAAILKCSETAVTTALKHAGVQMRNKWVASAEATKARTGFRRKSQLVSSVFQLGA